MYYVFINCKITQVYRGVLRVQQQEDHDHQQSYNPQFHFLDYTCSYSGSSFLQQVPLCGENFVFVLFILAEKRPVKLEL